MTARPPAASLARRREDVLPCEARPRLHPPDDDDEPPPDDVEPSSDRFSSRSLSGMTDWTVPATKPAAVATAWVTLSTTEPAVLLTASPAEVARSFIVSTIFRALAGARFTARREALATDLALLIMPPPEDRLDAPEDEEDFLAPPVDFDDPFLDAPALRPAAAPVERFAVPDDRPTPAPLERLAVLRAVVAPDDFFEPARAPPDRFAAAFFLPPLLPFDEEDDFAPPPDLPPDLRFAACLAMRPPFGSRILPLFATACEGNL